MENLIKYKMFTALADSGAKGEDTSVDRKNRKAHARYLSKVREMEIAAEEKETGKPHRSRKRSRSGRRKNR